MPRHARYPWAAALAIPLFCLAVSFYGKVKTPPDAHYTWTHSLNPGDLYTYLSWIEQARQGEILFRPLFTAAQGGAVLFHPLFLVIGVGARVFGVSSLAAFIAARVLLGIGCILLLHRVLARFIRSEPALGTTFLFLCVCGGLGWALLGSDELLTAGPPDLWMPEVSLFLSLLESPLNLCAWILVGGILLAVIGPSEDDRPRHALVAGLAAILGFVHPQEVATLVAVFAVSLLLAGVARRPPPRGFLSALVALLLGAAPALLYQYLVVARDPVFAEYARIVYTPSPSPARFVAAFAVALPPALFGVKRVLAGRRPRELLLLAWPIATTALIYAPLANQRRFALGVQLPLAILAGIGTFEVIVPALARRFRFSRAPRWSVSAATLLVLLVSALSGLTVVRRDLQAYRSGGYPYYLPSKLVAAIERFGEIAGKDAALLAHPNTSYMVPGMTGRAVYAGHYNLSVGLPMRWQSIRRFFEATTPDAERRSFLERAAITHVLHSPLERSLGSADPTQMSFLTEVWSDYPVRLFAVTD